ncbi:magnesium-dependent phosphatase 1-like isoform X2 [Ornithodoros turicata]|uniref:magnesium-dependent phosphatase 1-like isoform X2 n=1 Tax=Ornithodoros turicata TaxID=34597 RepID=UPI00313A1C32
MPPRLIVFDLDYTLWPLHVDCSVTPPLRKDSKGRIVDLHGQKVRVFPDVPEILERLKREQYALGVASRTDDPDTARQLLGLLDWNKYFSYQEIYPGCKVGHFNKFASRSGIPYKDMLFFDDEHRNIRDVSKLGTSHSSTCSGG